MRNVFKIIFVTLISLLVLAAGLVAAAFLLIDPAQLKPVLTSQVEQATGCELAINGAIEPTFGLSPTVVMHDVALDNAKWGQAEHFFTADRVTVRFELIPLLSKQFQVTGLSVENGQLSLERQGDQANWNFSRATPSADTDTDTDGDTDVQGSGEAVMEAASEATDNEAALQISSILITQSAVQYRDLNSGEHYELDIAQLDIASIQGGTVEDAVLKGQYRGAEISATAQLEGTLLLLDASVKKPGLSASFDGSFATDDNTFDGSIALDTSQLATLMQLAGEESDDTTALQMNARLGGTPELLSLSKFDARYGDYAAEGSGKINLTGTTPRIEGTVRMPTLDVTQDDLEAPEEDAEGAPILPDEPLALDALGMVNADLDLTIGTLKLPSLTFTEARADLSLKDRNLTLSNLVLGTGDGKLSGNIGLNAASNPPRLDGDLTAENLTLGALLLDLAGDDSFKGGKISAKLTLSGSGQSLKAMLGSANGAYQMYIEEAVYTPPQNVQQASRFFDLLRGGSGSGPVTLECSVADLAITNGVADIETLAIKSPAALVSGDGNINLGAETLRIELEARSRLVGFADVVPPLVIAGSWSDPVVTLNARSTLFSLGKFAIGAATGVGIAAFIGEQITDKLGITAESNPCIKEIAEAQEEAKEADANPKEALKDAEENVRSLRDEVKGNLESQIKDAEDRVRGLRDGIRN